MFEEIYNTQQPINSECFDDYGNPVPCPENQTTEVTIEPPVEEENPWLHNEPFPTSLRPSDIKEPPGATLLNPDRDLKTLDINQTFIDNNITDSERSDYNAAFTLFNSLNQWPVIDGIPIKDSEKLTELMQYPEYRKQIMDFAKPLMDSPEIDAETLIQVNDTLINGILSAGYAAEGKRIIEKDLYDAAKNVDAKLKIKDDLTDVEKELQLPVSHASMFTADGKMLSKGDWILNTINTIIDKENERRAAILKTPVGQQLQRQYRMSSNESMIDNNKKRAANLRAFADGKPLPYPEAEKSAPTIMGQQVVRANNLPGSRYNVMAKPSNEQIAQNINTEIGSYAPISHVTLKNYKNYAANGISFSSLNKIYDDYKTRITNQYNLEESTSVKVKAAAENKLRQNKGGITQAIPNQITFDGDDDVDEEGYTRPEIEEYANVLKMALDNPNSIKIAAGDIQGKVPSGSDLLNNSEDFIGKLIADASADHNKGGALVPKGVIKFQDIVENDQKYHAYNIRFNSNEKGKVLSPVYLNHKNYRGTKDMPLWSMDNDKLLNEGFTIYVPAEISEADTFFGKYSKIAKNTSASAGLLNLSGNLNLDYSGAGGIKVVKDVANNKFIISGYNVAFNPNTLQMDTIPIPDKTELPFDQATMVDGIINAWKEEMHYNLKANHERKQAVLNIQNSKQ